MTGDDQRQTAMAETLSVPVAAARLGISRNAGYRAAARGELPVIRVGGRVLVLRRALDRLLAADTDEAA